MCLDITVNKIDIGNQKPIACTRGVSKVPGKVLYNVYRLFKLLQTLHLNRTIHDTNYTMNQTHEDVLYKMALLP